MKIFLSTTLLLAALAFFAGCSSKTYPVTNYQQAPVTADGNLSEWNRPLKFISSGGQMQYNITNDDSNLYVSLETHDEATVTKILRAGIDVYVDAEGGESKKVMLAFPLPNNDVHPEKRSTNDAAAAANAKAEMRQELLIQANLFTVAGFKNMENRSYDINDQSRIRVGLKQEPENGLGYEAAIPFKYIFANPSDKNKKNISVGIVINAMKEGQRPGGGNSTGRGQMPGGGGRGMGGGGGGRGMHGGGGGGGTRPSRSGGEGEASIPDRTAMMTQDANWYKFKLATAKK
jgi:hypothetical protein